MKKISLILIMALIAIAFTSCEDESIDSQDNFAQSKSGFNAEATYWSILDNVENGMEQFDALENSEKQQIWLFKYDRFIDDNSLSTSQLNAVNAVKSYVESADFDAEPNESEENALEDQINSSFDSDTVSFLLLTLENGTDDISQQGPSNQTLGCFWCSDASANPGPCERVIVNGDFIGFQRVSTARVRRFWIGWANRDVVTPCNGSDWANDGYGDWDQNS